VRLWVLEVSLRRWLDQYVIKILQFTGDANLFKSAVTDFRLKVLLIVLVCVSWLVSDAWRNSF